MNGIYQKLLKFYLPNRSSQTDRDLKNINETQKLLHRSKTATSYLKLLHPNPSPRLIETLKLIQNTSKTATYQKITKSQKVLWKKSKKTRQKSKVKKVKNSLRKMLYHQVVVNGKKVINEDVERYQKLQKGVKKQKNGSRKQSCKVLELFCIGRLQEKGLKSTWRNHLKTAF